MAKRRKRSGFNLFLSVFWLLVIWAAAFLVWLFWSDIQRLKIFRGEQTPVVEPQRKSQEKISEQERKKLDEILKRRQREKEAPRR